MAIDRALEGIEAGDGGPFGSVIVKDGKVVGVGHNKVVKDNNPTLHGEMVAIADACHNLGTFDLSGCEIYTTGEPCHMCLCACMWANIDKIYYGCTGYPACKFLSWDVPTGDKCPKCGKFLIKKGKEIKCSDKNCDYTTPAPEEDENS